MTTQAELTEALKIVGAPALDLSRLDVMQLHQVRNEAEASRGMTKAWLAEARGRRYTLQEKIDVALYDRVDAADKAWAERIRLVSCEFAWRKRERSAASFKPHTSPPVASKSAERERDEAQEACRRLAAEVERLTAELKEAKRSTTDAGLHRAFYESAQFILAESTFNRIRDKARQLLASVKARP